MNRRDELLTSAIKLFAERGFDGVSVAELVSDADMSKAAFGYHLESKDHLLLELAEPLLSELEAVVSSYSSRPRWPDEIELMLSDYVDVLLRHRDLVIWVDSDKAVQSHPIVGERLRRNHQAMRRALRGDSRSSASRIISSSVLGAIWRPMKSLPDVNIETNKDAVLAAALAVAGALRT